MPLMITAGRCGWAVEKTMVFELRWWCARVLGRLKCWWALAQVALGQNAAERASLTGGVTNDGGSAQDIRLHDTWDVVQ